MKIELGKTYRTRDGREVRIYAVDAGGHWPIHGAFLADDNAWTHWVWRENGRQDIGHDHFTDLIEVKPRIKRKVWVNVYRDAAMDSGSWWSTKEMADAGAVKGKRIACIPITIDCEEGQGLE